MLQDFGRADKIVIGTKDRRNVDKVAMCGKTPFHLLPTRIDWCESEKNASIEYNRLNRTTDNQGNDDRIDLFCINWSRIKNVH